MSLGYPITGPNVRQAVQGSFFQHPRALRPSMAPAPDASGKQQHGCLSKAPGYVVFRPAILRFGENRASLTKLDEPTDLVFLR